MHILKSVNLWFNFFVDKKKKVWQSVTIGKFPDRRSLELEFLRRGVSFTPEVSLMLTHFKLHTFVSRWDLVLLSLGDLGLSGNTLFLDRILETSQKEGLVACPADIGPYLRFQLPALAKDLKYFVMMDTVRIAYHNAIFCLQNAELAAADPSAQNWSKDSKFIFSLPMKD